MSKCDVCINKNYCVNNLDARTMCPQKDYVLFTPSYETNYERLISKTPEELADELLDLFSAFYSVEWSKDTLLAWLKSPVEVET